jgi:hypothetical protein
MSGAPLCGAGYFGRFAPAPRRALARHGGAQEYGERAAALV